jgi:hypothetical protein
MLVSSPRHYYNLFLFLCLLHRAFVGGLEERIFNRKPNSPSPRDRLQTINKQSKLQRDKKIWNNPNIIM